MHRRHPDTPLGEAKTRLVSKAKPAAKPRPRTNEVGQLALDLPVAVKGKRGGKRANAGRKPANRDARKNMSHRRRPDHAARCPVHVTMRVVKSVPSLRSELVRNMLKKALNRQAHRDYGGAFQVVHFSIQEDHLHLAVEAKGASLEEIAQSPRLLSRRAKRGLETKERDMLRRGIAGIAISFARTLNGLLGRKGKVWADRHHRRDLATPTEVRNALLYLFQNFRRHGVRVHGVGVTDMFSTAPWFSGWLDALATYEILAESEPWRPPARTGLLGRGWLRAGGPISTNDAPPLSPRVRLSPEARAYESEQATARRRLDVPS